MLYIGNNIGFRENLKIEFKLFTLKRDPIIYYSEEEIKEIVITGIIDPDKFNLMISDNICHFFKYYIPKYLSVFGNSDLDNATLYMGVNDFGEFTGVPFFSEITPNYLKSFLDCIKPFISFNNTDNTELEELKELEEFLSLVSFEVIKLETNTLFLDDTIKDILDNFKNKKNKYEIEYRNNLLERMKWMEKVEYHIVRIQDYATYPRFRKEISNYVLQNNTNNDPELYKISELLLSDELIDVGDGDVIRSRKDNLHDVIYWITKYKDHMTDILRDQKPIKIPFYNFSQNIYSNQFSLLSNLRYRFIENNKNINYFLIKINFPTRYSKKIYFRNNDYDIWNIRIRAIVNGGPGCL